MDKYRLISRKGEGTFSEVFKAQSVVDGKYVAMKCMKSKFESSEQGENLREVQALRRLSPHPNIVDFHDVLYDKKTKRLALVFELLDLNAYELIKGRRHYLQLNLVKIYMFQALRGMAHMHAKGIFHRDIKPENILLESQYDIYTGLKLADFGSCRGIHSRKPYTEYISTRWYRAPECLLTDGYYGPEMDIWGLGCVFFEISALVPLFPGKDEADQIRRIHAIMGTPNKEVLSYFLKHPTSHMSLNFAPQKGTGIGALAPHLPEGCVDLMNKMLIYDPRKRITAADALNHPYFDDLKAIAPEPPLESREVAKSAGAELNSKPKKQQHSPSAAAAAAKHTKQPKNNAGGHAALNKTGEASVVAHAAAAPEAEEIVEEEAGLAADAPKSDRGDTPKSIEDDTAKFGKADLGDDDDDYVDDDFEPEEPAAQKKPSHAKKHEEPGRITFPPLGKKYPLENRAGHAAKKAPDTNTLGKPQRQYHKRHSPRGKPLGSSEHQSAVKTNKAAGRHSNKRSMAVNANISPKATSTSTSSSISPSKTGGTFTSMHLPSLHRSYMSMSKQSSFEQSPKNEGHEDRKKHGSKYPHRHRHRRHHRQRSTGVSTNAPAAAADASPIVERSARRVYGVSSLYSAYANPSLFGSHERDKKGKYRTRERRVYNPSNRRHMAEGGSAVSGARHPSTNVHMPPILGTGIERRKEARGAGPTVAKGIRRNNQFALDARKVSAAYLSNLPR